MIFKKEKNYIKKIKIKSLSKNSKNIFWTIKISLLALFLSLLLSIFSQYISQKNNIIIATILLIIFMSLNVLSDMLGLAITSCQIEQINREVDNKNIRKICLLLIKNSDKVSSILCDVIGDICGILCGVSGVVLTNIILTNNLIDGLVIFIGVFISSFIAGITVLLKAISKNYAINNSLKIVNKIAKILNYFINFKK